MRYKGKDSCSNFGLQSFIDEFVLICKSDSDDIKDMKDRLIGRLKVCIMDRLYDQKYFSGDDEHIKNHFNIIKVYYDLYIKLKKYFDVLYVFILSGKGKIIKLKNTGNFTNSLFLEIINKDDSKKEFLPFTDINQDLSYLYKLEVGKEEMTKYNREILNKNITDWSTHPDIIKISYEIKKRELDN
jgi:hypothetical protein